MSGGRGRPRAPSPLRRRSAVPPWVALAWRVFAAFALIGVVLAVHWFDRVGLRDNVDGHISFIDVMYFTMITVTTVGFGDIVPVTPRARMFDTFVVTPVRLFVWLIFLGTAYDFLLKRTWERWRMGVIQKRLSGHVLLCGYGTSGSAALRELVARGTPAQDIVVIDEGANAIAAAETCGANVLEGDATRNVTLEAARIATARSVIVSAGRDDTSILIVLTARRLAPDVPISVVIRNEDNEALAHQAGANTVINPAHFAGLLLAGSTHGQHLANYLSDLAAAHGEVALHQRDASPDDFGKPLAHIATGLGVRLYRGGKAYGFWQIEAARIEPGDQIVEIVPQMGDPQSSATD
ncbi:potassium channel family protein [uncultured Sphingomonas sp.]|uniref:potassium channel family protein n=1 Tax=uncultured Sphingomonas sp. TaxID=158754 RepID=UPI0025F836D5|nr:potassium channel family protein [uncultured Sphingomonas sp.]